MVEFSSPKRKTLVRIQVPLQKTLLIHFCQWLSSAPFYTKIDSIMARRRKIKKPDLSHPKKPLFDLEDQTKKAILAVLFFSFAIIILLSVWQKAGPFGSFVYKIFNYLFGWGYFILPAVFLMMAYEFLKSRRQHIYFATIFGAFLLLVSKSFCQSTVG